MPRLRLLLVLVAAAPLPATAQTTVLTTRACLLQSAATGGTVADSVGPGQPLPIRVEADVYAEAAAVRWNGQDLFAPRTCLRLGAFPAGYTGDRLDSLIGLSERLRATPPAKGEYETTREYQARVRRSREALRYGDRTADSPFVVVVPIEAEEADYDADRSTMRVRFIELPFLTVDSPPAETGRWGYVRAPLVHLRSRKPSSRATRRTFPARVYLAAQTDDYGGQVHTLRDLDFYLPRRAAQAVERHLRAAITLHLRPPYLSVGVEVEDGLVEGRVALHGAVAAVEIFHGGTGEILAERVVELPRDASDDVVEDAQADLERVDLNGFLREDGADADLMQDAPFEVADVEVAPQKISGNDPEYPDSLRRARREGRIVMRVLVGRDGRVRDVQVTSSDHPAFSESSIRAVHTWRYEPAISGGRAVDVWLTVPIRFRQAVQPSTPNQGEGETGGRAG